MRNRQSGDGTSSSETRCRSDLEMRGVPRFVWMEDELEERPVETGWRLGEFLLVALLVVTAVLVAAGMVLAVL